jgi:hypothetical protein
MPICSVDRQGRAPARLLVGRGSRTIIDSAEAADDIDKSGAAYLRTCRAVIDRLVTARRVFWPIASISRETTRFFGLTARPFGSLAAPKKTDERDSSH